MAQLNALPQREAQHPQARRCAQLLPPLSRPGSSGQRDQVTAWHRPVFSPELRALTDLRMSSPRLGRLSPVPLQRASFPQAPICPGPAPGHAGAPPWGQECTHLEGTQALFFPGPRQSGGGCRVRHRLPQDGVQGRGRARTSQGCPAGVSPGPGYSRSGASKSRLQEAVPLHLSCWSTGARLVWLSRQHSATVSEHLLCAGPSAR